MAVPSLHKPAFLRYYSNDLLKRFAVGFDGDTMVSGAGDRQKAVDLGLFAGQRGQKSVYSKHLNLVCHCRLV